MRYYNQCIFLGGEDLYWFPYCGTGIYDWTNPIQVCSFDIIQLCYMFSVFIFVSLSLLPSSPFSPSSPILFSSPLSLPLPLSSFSPSLHTLSLSLFLPSSLLVSLHLSLPHSRDINMFGGREVISRYTTDIDNNGVWYTDANGREIQRRQ